MIYKFDFEDTGKCPFFIIHAQDSITYRLEIKKDANIISQPLKSGGDIKSLYLYPENPDKGKVKVTDKILKKTVIHCLKQYLSNHDRDLLYFIPDDIDNRSSVRLRKFSIWHNTEDTSGLSFVSKSLVIHPQIFHIAFIFSEQSFNSQEILDSLVSIVEYGEDIEKVPADD